MVKLVCPECRKEITTQTTVEIPNTEIIPAPSATYGTLICKKGKHFLILESVCTCPFCQALFGFDLCLKLEDMDELQVTTKEDEVKP